MISYIKKLFVEKKFHYAVFSRVEWKEWDAQALKDFLSTDTGKKLLDAMENHEATAASLACARECNDRDFVSGEVSGLRKNKVMLLLMANTTEQQKSAKHNNITGHIKGDDDLDQEQLDKVINEMISKAAREPVLG
jgi:hypothetical protein